MHVEDIEKACDKSIIIEDTEHNESLARCNLQSQSPLFSVLPREIRDLIWTFATAPVEDENNKYAATEYYCRSAGQKNLHVLTGAQVRCFLPSFPFLCFVRGLLTLRAGDEDQLLKRLLALNPADRPSAIEVLNAMNSESSLDGVSRAPLGPNPALSLQGRRSQNLDSPLPPSTPIQGKVKLDSVLFLGS